MGIRGLTTYIARHSREYHKDHKLQGCYLVIDGNSLAAQLYGTKSNLNCAFGGDYNRYATLVKDFFLLLEKCNVKPLVVFDGGYHHRKLRTAELRLREKVLRAKHITPVTQSRTNFFPSLLRHVFRDVLCELKVPFAQCLFEADEEIAAIARCLGCPVLSYDSDFYVYDVLYIPFPTLCMVLCKDDACDESSTLYLPCSLYKVENFLNRFGGLKKEMLPLLATLLGNDYIRRKVFSDFVFNLKRPKCRSMNDTQRSISGLLEWLRGETLQTATYKVMHRLNKEKRKIVAEQVQRILSLYTHCSSVMLPVLGLDNIPAATWETNTAPHLKVEDESMNSDSTEEEGGKPDHNFVCSSLSGDDVESDDAQKLLDTEDKESDCEQFVYNITCPGVSVKAGEYDTSWLPSWFVLNFQQGTLPPVFMDMIMLKRYLLPPQVEDYNYQSSHTISVPIIGAIYGLLITGRGRKEWKLACYARNNVSFQKIMVHPVFCTQSIRFPPLHDLPSFPLSNSLKLILEVSTLDSGDQNKILCLPPLWQLYLLSVVYWARKSQEIVINNCHIHAVLICLLVLDIVDRKVKCCGSRNQIKKQKKNIQKKSKKADKNAEIRQTGRGCAKSPVISSCSESLVESEACGTEDHGQVPELRKISQSGKGVASFESKQLKTGTECRDTNREGKNIEKTSQLNLADRLKQITTDDCLLARDIVYQYRQMEEKMKTCPKLFCVTTVHTFAQLQSSMLHFIYLNALLGHPLSNFSPSYVFSGTFLYNMYSNLIGRTDASSYISQLFSVSPSIVKLLTEMYSVLVELLPGLPCGGRTKRRPRRKKHKNVAVTTDCDENDEKSEPSEKEFEDASNRFSALTLANDI